jgi:hypothetical protein
MRLCGTDPSLFGSKVLLKKGSQRSLVLFDQLLISCHRMITNIDLYVTHDFEEISQALQAPGQKDSATLSFRASRFPMNRSGCRKRAPRRSPENVSNTK